MVAAPEAIVAPQPAAPSSPHSPVRRRLLEGVVPERPPARASAYVCEPASCLSAQSDQVLDQIAHAVNAAGCHDVAVKRVGCLGLCAAGPLVRIPETGRLFEHVLPEAVAD